MKRLTFLHRLAAIPIAAVLPNPPQRLDTPELDEPQLSPMEPSAPPGGGSGYGGSYLYNGPDININITADLARVTRGMRRLKESMEKFGREATTASDRMRALEIMARGL